VLHPLGLVLHLLGLLLVLHGGLLPAPGEPHAHRAAC
jgi:hypothetical protein